MRIIGITMEQYPSPEHTNAEVLNSQKVRDLYRAEDIADSADGLPTRQQAGADVIDITNRLDARTLEVAGQTTADAQEVTAHTENFTDPESGKTKDLHRTVDAVEAEAQQELAELGLATAEVDRHSVESSVIAAGMGEDLRGLHSKATEKLNDDVVTDETQKTVEQQAVLATVKQELDSGAEALSLSQDARNRLGAMSVADVVSLRPEATSTLHTELTTKKSDELVGYSVDGEEQRFKHSTESGLFLMNVLNGRIAEAAKELSDDGKEQLAARIEDFQEKYGVKNLSDATLEIRDLQRLERIFFRDNKDEHTRHTYDDAQHEAA